MWRMARGLLVEAVVILKLREFRKSHHTAYGSRRLQRCAYTV